MPLLAGSQTVPDHLLREDSETTTNPYVAGAHAMLAVDGSASGVLVSEGDYHQTG